MLSSRLPASSSSSVSPFLFSPHRSPSFQDLTFSLKSPSLCYHSTRGSQKELWYWKQAWHERRGFRGNVNAGGLFKGRDLPVNEHLTPLLTASHPLSPPPPPPTPFPLLSLWQNGNETWIHEWLFFVICMDLGQIDADEILWQRLGEKQHQTFIEFFLLFFFLWHTQNYILNWTVRAACGAFQSLR